MPSSVFGSVVYCDGLSRNKPSLRKELNIINVFDFLIDDEDIVQGSRDFFISKHYKQAVTEAYVCMNNYVKKRSGKTELDGTGLMRKVFTQNSPILKLNKLKTKSQKDEQEGYMNIYAGCMLGIRNPRVHEHDLKDHPEIALEMIVFANHLIKKAKTSIRARLKKTA